MDSSVAPAEDDAATLETIPGDALGVVQQFIGFHSSPAVSAVSTSLYGGSNHNPDLSPAPSDHSDSDSDPDGDEEGVHWEWMNIPATLGGGRVKLMLDQRERRKRRRAARNS